MQENLDRVLVFLCQILRTRPQNQFPIEYYLEALSTAKCWCKLSKATFVPNHEFIQIVFHMMENDAQCFSSAISVVKKLLVESKHVKALEYNNEKEAFKIPEVDRQFLQSIILYCARQRDAFIAQTSQPFSEDDDEEKPFARKICQLVT